MWPLTHSLASSAGSIHNSIPTALGWTPHPTNRQHIGSRLSTSDPRAAAAPRPPALHITTSSLETRPNPLPLGWLQVLFLWDTPWEGLEQDDELTGCVQASATHSFKKCRGARRGIPSSPYPS
eukprot:scaffold205222_cov33-Tisochrysis_lutea.AAC.1